jgi:hypothetical protein
MKPVVAAAATAVVVGSIAGFVGGTLGSRSRGAKKVGYVTILLSGTPADCKAKVFPEVLEIEKNWDVDWTIGDLCGVVGTRHIELVWINRADSDPDVGDDPLQSPASDKKRMKRVLKNGVDNGDRFRYQVWLVSDTDPRDRTLLADPDVDIVQY